MAIVEADADETILRDFIVAPPGPRQNWRLEDFEILHRLGKGQYGDVVLASLKRYNYVVALKVMELDNLVKLNVISQLRREVEIAFHTRHKYLLRTFSYFFDKKRIVLVMEPASRGMLFSELNKVKRFPPSTAARYVAQLAEALMYLHKHHILHRDIKPENILLDHNFNLKLADFGWSVHDPTNNRRTTACGTTEYFPPEIVRGSPYDASADLWSLGIFCHELLVGSTPFFSEELKEIYTKIYKGSFTIPDTVPPEAKDLIQSLLRRDGSTRLSLNRVVRHDFLMKYYYVPNNISPPTMNHATGKRHRDAN